MIRAACHCTAVRLKMDEPPAWVIDCNCTLCRRYGALWAYYKAGEVRLLGDPGATDAYVWGNGWIAFHFCKTCGCITHHSVIGADPPWIRGVNARMMPTLDPASVNLQQTDNSHTGWFWTRPADKFQPGGQPKMDPPGPDDWR